MEMKNPPLTWGLLVCDFIHAVLLLVLVPALCFFLTWTYGEFKRFTNPANWTMTTANVKSVSTVYIPKSKNLGLNLDVQVRNGPVFQDSFPPMKGPVALEYKKEIQQTGKVAIYQSNAPIPEYALSYIYTGHTRYLNLLFFGGPAGLLVIVLVANSWKFFRERIRLASCLRTKFARPAQHANA